MGLLRAQRAMVRLLSSLDCADSGSASHQDLTPIGHHKRNNIVRALRFAAAGPAAGPATGPATGPAAGPATGPATGPAAVSSKAKRTKP